MWREVSIGGALVALVAGLCFVTPVLTDQPLPDGPPTPRPVIIWKSPNTHLVNRTKDTWLDAINWGLCGQRMAKKPEIPKPQQRISGGRKAWYNEFPWHVILTYKVRKEKRRYNCSGVLIHENLVLTSAHCLMAPNNRMIWNHDIRVYDSNMENYINVNKFYIHPGYPPRHLVTSKRPPNLPQYALHADFAVMRLDSPWQYGKRSWPICLALNGMQGEIEGRLYPTKCYVAGRGVISNRDDKWIWAKDLMTMMMKPCGKLSRYEILANYMDEKCFESANRYEWFGRPCYGEEGAALMCERKEKHGGNRFWVVGLYSEANTIYGCDVLLPGPENQNKTMPRAFFTDAALHSYSIKLMARMLLQEVKGLPPGMETRQQPGRRHRRPDRDGGKATE